MSTLLRPTSDFECPCVDGVNVTGLSKIESHVTIVPPPPPVAEITPLTIVIPEPGVRTSCFPANADKTAFEIGLLRSDVLSTFPKPRETFVWV